MRRKEREGVEGDMRKEYSEERKGRKKRVEKEASEERIWSEERNMTK